MALPHSNIFNALFPGYASGRGAHSTPEDILTPVVPTNPPPSLSPPVFSPASFYNNEKYSDVVVILDDESIFGHRVFLQRNEVFDRMMQNAMTENQTRIIRLYSITPENAKIYLQYLYGIPIPQNLSFDQLLPLLAETHRYMDKDFTNQLWSMIDTQRGASFETRIKALDLETVYRDRHHQLTPHDFDLEVIAGLSYPIILSLVTHLKNLENEAIHWSIALQWIGTHLDPTKRYQELLNLCSFGTPSLSQMKTLLTYTEIPVLHDIVLNVVQEYFDSVLSTPLGSVHTNDWYLLSYQDIKMFNDQRNGELSFEEKQAMDRGAKDESVRKRSWNDDELENPKIPKSVVHGDLPANAGRSY